MEMQQPSEPEENSQPPQPEQSPYFSKEMAEAPLQSLADGVREYWRGSVKSILQLGFTLLRIKHSRPHGDWGKIFKDGPKAVEVSRRAPITLRTAEHLMKIYSHPTLSNPTHWVELPSSWRTLVELARFDPGELERALKRGRVHPEVTRAEVSALIIRRQMPTASRRAVKHFATSLNTLRYAEEMLRNWANEVNRELVAPLQVTEDGRIESGVWWVPPFAQPIHATPIKVRHCCECGHAHPDRRTRP